MEHISDHIRSRRSVRTFDGRQLTTEDRQKIDMGIALCHFALTAKEINLDVTFTVNNPDIPVKDDTEYIASYLISQ